MRVPLVILALFCASACARSEGPTNSAVQEKWADSNVVGFWNGDVFGFSSQIKLLITYVKPDGKIEGGMKVFEHGGFFFGDQQTATSGVGVLEGQKLSIKTNRGGVYTLTMVNGMLRGDYRGDGGSRNALFTRAPKTASY